MKLVYVTSSLPFGPGEAFIIPEIQQLQKQGHAIKIVPLYPRGQPVHAAAKEMVDSATIQPPISLMVLSAAGKEFLRAPWRALRALRLLITFKPRHLLKNLSIYPKGLWLAGIARQWGAEHIHAHWAATTASMAMIASETTGIPWSFTAHRWDIVEGNLLARKSAHAKFTRFISRSGLEMALAKGVVKEKTLVLYLGVQLQRSDSRAGHDPNASRPFRLLCPASLLPVKGHKYLIQAISLLPKDVELWLAGDGELRAEIETHVRELGLSEHVRLLGQLPHEALIRLYVENQVDAVVLPSIDLGGGLHEGIPVSLIEAMSFGIPVISTRTGGIPELLEGGAGLLVSPQDSKALVEAIRKLMESPQLRQAIGVAGRKRVQEEFASEQVVARLEALFMG
jgi:colanic acid/amylovoran biosynthesis glycosyltransferase